MTTTTTKIRVSVQVFMGGHLYQPGEEVALPAGQRGPHRTHPRKHEHLDVNEDQQRVIPDHVDEPVHEVWDEATQSWQVPRP